MTWRQRQLDSAEGDSTGRFGTGEGTEGQKGTEGMEELEGRQYGKRSETEEWDGNGGGM